MNYAYISSSGYEHNTVIGCISNFPQSEILQNHAVSQRGKRATKIKSRKWVTTPGIATIYSLDLFHINERQTMPKIHVSGLNQVQRMEIRRRLI